MARKKSQCTLLQSCCYREYANTFSTFEQLCSKIRRTAAPPNQELSGGKFELQGETVGVCSFYKRGGQLPYNSALRSLQMCLFVQL